MAGDSRIMIEAHVTAGPVFTVVQNNPLNCTGCSRMLLEVIYETGEAGNPTGFFTLSGTTLNPSVWVIPPATSTGNKVPACFPVWAPTLITPADQIDVVSGVITLETPDHTQAAIFRLDTPLPWMRVAVDSGDFADLAAGMKFWVIGSSS